jgi:membrane protease YdiL (CAAX protease family)
VDGVVGGGQAVSVVVTLLTTTAAGAVLAWLRLRSGGILAPALLHLSTNALGTLAGFAAQRWA